MKRALIAGAVLALVAMTAVLVTRGRARSRAIHATAQVQLPPRPEFPMWKPAKVNVNGKETERLELFEQSGRCGYVEKWGESGTEMYMVFLVNNGNDDGQASNDPSGVSFVNGYNDLDAAKRSAEKRCGHR
jgi:hypothetical protein